MAVDTETKNKSSSAQEFEQLLAKDFEGRSLKENSIIKSTILEITQNHVVCDVKGKSEAMIDIQEFKEDGTLKDLKVGQEISLFLERVEDFRGNIVVSYEKAKRLKIWTKLEKAYENKEEVTGVIQSKIRGGFIVMVEGGYPCFCPQSHIDIRPVKKPESLFNTPLKFLPVRMDKSRANCSVSRRAVLEKSKNAEIKETLKELKEGDIVKAVVRGVTDYGAFMSYKNIDLLCHISDLSHSRVKSAKDLCNIGDEITIKIIKIDPETSRVSGSIKALTESPWENIDKKFKVGQLVEGTCTKLTDFGAFFELESNINALCHSSEISHTNRNIKASKLFSISQKINLKILTVEKETQRISVSYKATIENPWEKTNDLLNQEIKVKINNVTDKAIFAELDNGLNGMLHYSELSWEHVDPEILKNYKKGDLLDVKIIEIKNEKIRFSKRALQKDPFDYIKEKNIKEGDIITTRVYEVGKNQVKVSVDPDKKIISTIKRSDLAKEAADQRVEIFAKDNKLDAKVMEIKGRNIRLSVKAAQIDEEKSLVAKFGKGVTKSSGATLKGIFEKALGRKKTKPKKEEE
jgi:small subunit ribosomal protein S1